MWLGFNHAWTISRFSRRSVHGRTSASNTPRTNSPGQTTPRFPPPPLPCCTNSKPSGPSTSLRDRWLPLLERNQRQPTGPSCCRWPSRRDLPRCTRSSSSHRGRWFRPQPLRCWGEATASTSNPSFRSSISRTAWCPPPSVLSWMLPRGSSVRSRPRRRRIRARSTPPR